MFPRDSREPDPVPSIKEREILAVEFARWPTAILIETRLRYVPRDEKKSKKQKSGNGRDEFQTLINRVHSRRPRRDEIFSAGASRQNSINLIFGDVVQSRKGGGTVHHLGQQQVREKYAWRRRNWITRQRKKKKRNAEKAKARTIPNT